MTANTAHDTPSHEPPSHQAKQNLKAWWNHFRFAQQAKKEAEEKKGEYPCRSRCILLRPQACFGA